MRPGFSTVCHICPHCPLPCKAAIRIWHNPHPVGPHLFRLSVHGLMLVSVCANAVTSVQQPPVKSLAPDVCVCVCPCLRSSQACSRPSSKTYETLEVPYQTWYDTERKRVLAAFLHTLASVKSQEEAGFGCQHRTPSSSDNMCP